MKSQANYQLCQRNYTVLSGLRLSFTANIGANSNRAFGNLEPETPHSEAHHETSAPNIPQICWGLHCRARVFTRRNGGELSVAPHHDGRGVAGGQLVRCNPAGSCRAHKGLAWTAR